MPDPNKFTSSVHRWINSLIAKHRQWTAQLRDPTEEYTIDDINTMN